MRVARFSFSVPSVAPARPMTVQFIIEVNGQRQVFSWTSSRKRFSKQSELPSGRKSSGFILPGRPRHAAAKNSEVTRPVALSKAQAAQALGVSVRTIDNCIAQQKSACYASAGESWFP